MTDHAAALLDLLESNSFEGYRLTQNQRHVIAAAAHELNVLTRCGRDSADPDTDRALNQLRAAQATLAFGDEVPDQEFDGVREAIRLGIAALEQWRGAVFRHAEENAAFRAAARRILAAAHVEGLLDPDDPVAGLLAFMAGADRIADEKARLETENAQLHARLDGAIRVLVPGADQ